MKREKGEYQEQIIGEMEKTGRITKQDNYLEEFQILIPDQSLIPSKNRKIPSDRQREGYQ